MTSDTDSEPTDAPTDDQRGDGGGYVVVCQHTDCAFREAHADRDGAIEAALAHDQQTGHGPETRVRGATGADPQPAPDGGEDTLFIVGGRSTATDRRLHSDLDCISLRQASHVRAATAVERERHEVCEHCRGVVGQGEQDYSYQRALRAAAEDEEARTDGDVVAGTDHDQRFAVSERECRAMQLLSADGWSLGELALAFQVGDEDTARRHATGGCGHEGGASE